MKLIFSKKTGFHVGPKQVASNKIQNCAEIIYVMNGEDMVKQS